MTPSNSKPSVASDTASEDRLFRAARMRLAGISTLILAIIVFGFSYALYQSFAVHLQDTAEVDFVDAAAQQRVVVATLSAEWRDILMGDVVLIVIAAGVAYAFVGWMLRPVRQAVETQKAFAAHASHELRTPLAVVKNELEVLARNPHKTDADVDSALRNSLEEIVRMSEMTDSLLALARSEQGKERAKERVDLNEVLVTVHKSANHIAKAKGVYVQHKEDGPVIVFGNRADLERAIFNVLRNAIEHTSAGGVVTLTLLARQDGNALVRVADTGSGIAVADLPHVFNRFYKGTESSGSGLGLAIVKDSVEQHGGMVSIESELGKGTVVIVLLPTDDQV